MAQILVPGVAQVVLSGLYGSQPWALVWHFKYDNSTADWNSTNIVELANSVRDGWSVYLAPQASTAIHLQQVVATDIGSTNPTVGTNATASTGTRGGTPIPNSSTCAMIRFNINARYKGGHPRAYLPFGTTVDQLNESQWVLAFVSQTETQFANYIGNLRAVMPPSNGNQLSQVIPRYTYQVVDDPVHHKYVRQRIGLKSVDVVQNYTVNQRIATQRRRLIL